MIKLCSELKLTDVMARTHEELPDFATYARGTSRLDYVLATNNAFRAVRKCGYEPFHHRYVSDHRAFFVDFNFAELFGTETNPLPPLQYQDFKANSPKQVTQYLLAQDKYLDEHKFYERIELLSDDHSDYDLTESLDRDWRRSREYASKQCKQFRDPPWSI
jgi:hypothetical protein